MNLTDKDRIYSFLSYVTGAELPVRELFDRIDQSEIPGEYAAELISVSLGAKKLKT